MKKFLSVILLFVTVVAYSQANLSVEYLVVAGGGGGAAGGGGGGVLSGTNYSVPKNSPITVTVGKGGNAGSGQVLGTNGDNSVFGALTAIGGGSGGSKSGLLPSAGGSGGGGGWDQPAISPAAGTAGQGYAGGLSNRAGYGASGGGGGAGAAGSNATTITATSGRGGNGGNGISSSISGTATYYGGGGGGGINDNSGTLITNGGGTGGLGGGGNGSAFGVSGSGSNFTGSAGTANTGGGGGGTDCESTVAGAGGAGIVIIRYPGTPIATGGTITQSGGYTLHTFTSIGSSSFTYTPSADANLTSLTISTGTLSPAFAGGTINYMATVPAATASITVTPVKSHTSASITVNGSTVISGNASGEISLAMGVNTISVVVTAQDASTKTYTLSVTRGFSVDYLVVAGGGGGASGGGGGGGVLTANNYVISSGQTLQVTVGSGGAAGSGTVAASNGSNSVFGSFTAVGGGAGGSVTPILPSAGGSGGGGGWDQPTIARAAGTSGQGNAGGLSNRAGFGGGGGGGGAAASGSDGTSLSANSGRGGNGGNGISSSISGSTAYYGGGGGGGINDNSNTVVSNGGGTGGLGGGGNGSSMGYFPSNSNFNGTSGAANTGGGGGGTDPESLVAGSGGSGIVIIRYPGAPVATGGTVSQSGGYTLHTYTSVGSFSFVYDISNANLSALTTSSGALSPAFSAATTNYSVNVSNATTSITVTPTRADAFASIQVNGVTVSSGMPSEAIALSIGNNPVNVVVTAQDGTVKTYTLIITRACNTPAEPTADGDTICAGTSTNLSATGIGTIGWYSAATNGVYLGGGANFTTPILNSSVTYYVQDSTCGASATRKAVTVTVLSNWLGGTGNWSESTNWCGGVVPGPGDNITINAGNLLLDIDFTLTGNLTINGAGSLTVKAGKTLTVATGGVADFGNRPVVFESALNGTAALGKVSGTVSGATNVTVERYIPKNTNRSWRLLSIPASGQTIHEAWQENQDVGVNGIPGYGTNLTSSSPSWATNGFDFYTPGNSLYSYDAASDNLLPVTATNTAIAGEPGYFIYIRGDRGVSPSSSIAATNATVLRTKGSINIGTQAAVNVMADKFALVGNPYPSAIDVRNIALSGGCAGTSFYVWDPKLLGFYQLGGFQTLTPSGENYIVVPGGGSYGPNGSITNTIQSGAAFFVQATGSAGTIGINENSKATGSSMVFRPVGMPEPSLTVTLYAVNGSTKEIADGSMVFFNDNYTDAVDNIDSRKFTNFGENFGILKNNNLLVVERRKLPASNDIIQLDMTYMKKRTYQLKLATTQLMQTGMLAFLEDAYLNTSTALNIDDSTSYSFEINGDAGSVAKDRFKIVLKPAVVLPVTITSLKAWKVPAGIAVEWQVDNQVNMQEYRVEKSTNGKDYATAAVIAATNTDSATYHWTDVNPTEGDNFYRISMVNADGRSRYTQMIKVTTGKIAKVITVSPNPVTGSVMNLQVTNQPTGIYLLKLLSTNGQAIFKTSFKHNGGNARHAINLPAGISDGAYQLEVVTPGKTSNTQSIIIRK